MCNILYVITYKFSSNTTDFNKNPNQYGEENDNYPNQ